MTEPEHINYPLVRPAAFQGGASKAETSQAAVYNIHLTLGDPNRAPDWKRQAGHARLDWLHQADWLRKRGFFAARDVFRWRMFGERGEIGASRCRKEEIGIMITAAQCRSARTLLSWSINKLASAASVSGTVIDDFELERREPDAATLDAIRRAFEDVGVVFLPDGDVRMRATESTAT
jgi:hypothetical protein